MKNTRAFGLLQRINEQKSLSGLALLIEYGLYALYQPTSQFVNALKDFDHVEVTKNIIAACETRPSKNPPSDEVKSIFSRGGYGPTMYLIVMQIAGKRGLVPNTYGMVSAPAKKVWQEFYSGKGAPLVAHTPVNLGNVEEYLNQTYFIKRPLNITSAKVLHKRVLSSDRYGEMKDVLLEAIDGLLSSEMQRIY
jgi:hypothetical protein